MAAFRELRIEIVIESRADRRARLEWSGTLAPIPETINPTAWRLNRLIGLCLGAVCVTLLAYTYATLLMAAQLL